MLVAAAAAVFRRKRASGKQSHLQRRFSKTRIKTAKTNASRKKKAKMNATPV